jgi:hypothetical protein
MKHRPICATAVALVLLTVAACGAGAPAAPPTPTAKPLASTYQEAEAAICSGFGSMLRAVGNPDTASPSILSKPLDDAVTAGDAAAADGAAAGMMRELETGRQQAAFAAGWAPARPTAVAMETLLVAFEAATAAKQAAARHTPGAVPPQAAFEQAHGVDAWTAMLQGITTMPVPSGVTPVPCPAFSGTP